MRTPLKAAAGALAVGVASLALVATATLPASAHSQLIGSNPSEGETLTELPELFSATLNERLLTDAGDAAFALRARDADGLYYGDGCLTIDDATVSTPAALGEPGDYVLEWQVVSADGHPVGGEIAFTWDPASEFTPAVGSATAAKCGVETPAEPGTDEHAGDEGHASDSPAASLAVGDVIWIVGAVLAVAIAVTVAILYARKRPTA